MLTGLKKMFEVALEGLRFLHQGLSSNWWGLGCPVHCRGTDLGSLVSAFLLGFLLASACGLYLAFRLAPPSEVVARPASSEAGHPQVRRRLQGHVHGRAGDL